MKKKSKTLSVRGVCSLDGDGGKMVEKSYWESIAGQYSLPKTIKLDPWGHYSLYKIDSVIKKYIRPTKSKTLLEIGCCPGTWLHYFNKRFGFSITGIDYGKTAVKITQKNFAILQIQGNVICQDVFSRKIKGGPFDVVFSMGFIEHFKKPDVAIKRHILALNKGGFLIVGVPNIHPTIYGKVQGLIDKKNLNQYRHITKEEIQNMMKKEGIRQVFCDYVGGCNFSIVDASRLPKLFRYGYYITAKLVDFFIVHLLRIKTESSKLSPYIIYIGRKL